MKDLFTAEWFPYYFERFEGSDRVAAMSLAEEGAYHRAIRLAWKYGSVPADSALLAAKIGKRCTEKIAEAVLRMFEPVKESPGRMMHPTVEGIRREQQEKASKFRKGGLATAQKRWGFEPVTVEKDSPAIAKLKHRNSIAVADRDRDLDLDKDSDSVLRTDDKVAADAAPDAEHPPADQAHDPVERRIWNDGTELVKRSGDTDKAARRLLGHLAKVHGRVELAQAIAATQAVNSPDPKAYMLGVLTRKVKGRADMQVGKSVEDGAVYGCMACFDAGVRMVPDPKGEHTWSMIEIACDQCGVRERAA